MMLRPAYRLTIGGRIVNTTDEPRASTAVDLIVRLGFGVPADDAVLVLAPVDGLRPARDDDVVVELGYADDGSLERVLTGTVVDADIGLVAVRVSAYGGAAALLGATIERTYENQSAGDIVRDLASQAGLQVAASQPGIQFPAYVVDGRRSFYHHMRDLAELCGFDVYVDNQGEVVFAPFVGNAVHVFEHGEDVLALDLLENRPAAARVEAWGESPGGGQGADAWAWLTKDFSGSRGSAGSGDPLLLLERSGLRSAQAASSAADAALARLQRRTRRGRLLTTGRPQIRLGDAIRVRNAPDDRINDRFKVTGVTHRITKAAGFLTTVEFEGIT
jgi:phage protein D